MRIFLTMFGIVWGIASVILLVGLGRGFSVDQKKHMQTLGKDLVIVWGGRTSSQVGRTGGGHERFTSSWTTPSLIRDECYLVKNVSPELRRTIPEVSPFNSRQPRRGGHVAVVSGFPLAADFRRPSDHRRRRTRRPPRVVLGSKAYRQQFPGTAGGGRDAF